jgi:hypothetical protein
VYRFGKAFHRDSIIRVHARWNPAGDYRTFGEPVDDVLPIAADIRVGGMALVVRLDSTFLCARVSRISDNAQEARSIVPVPIIVPHRTA